MKQVIVILLLLGGIALAQENKLSTVPKPDAPPK